MIDTKTLGEWSHKLGYAIGVLEGLADLSDLDERQTRCVDDALAGLREIDLLALSCEERAEKKGQQ